MSSSDVVRSDTEQKALGLFKFLKEFSILRTRTVRSLDTYANVVWLSQIPKKQGCHVAAWFRGQDADASQLEAWVEIKKPKLPKFPELGSKLEPWVDLKQLHDSSIELPDIQDSIFVEVAKLDSEEKAEESTDIVLIESSEPAFERKLLQDSPEIQSAWEEYVENKWQPWAEMHSELLPVQEVYSDLFHLHKTQQRLGEQYEVVLGLGLLKWKLESGHSIKRHIIVAQTAIELEASTGTLRVGVAGEGAKLLLEQDMLDPADRPDVDIQRDLQKQLNEVGDNVWEPSAIDSILKSWINDIAPGSEYLESIEEHVLDWERPKIYLAPAILLRKRTERSNIRAFSEIINRIESGEELPAGVEQFVSIVADHYQPDGPKPQQHLTSDSEVYFPLEANDAQKQIVNKLKRSQGVLVQGPPGTGKSHTIVNLISHLLASGKRVLVTSHTARALSVLRNIFEDRLPELAPLAVVVLGDDRESLKAMEQSVQGITNRHNYWNKSDNDRKIETLDKKLADCRSKLATVNEELRAARESEVYEHSPRFGVYEGTLQTIASKVNQEQSTYGFLKDELDEDAEVPLSSGDFRELLGLLRDPSVEKIDTADWHVVDPDRLPSVQVIEQKFAEEKALLRKYKSYSDSREHENYPVFKECATATLYPIEKNLKQLIVLADRLIKHIHSWTDIMLKEVLADQDRPWWELLDTTKSDLDTIREIENWADELTLAGIGERDLKTLLVDATDLREHIAAGGRWGLGPFRSDVVKKGLYLKTDVKIDGQQCDNESALSRLIKWLEVQIILQYLAKRWALYASVGDLDIRIAIAKYDDFCEPIEIAKDLFDRVRSLQVGCSEIAGFIEPVWHNVDELRALHRVLEGLDIERQFVHASSWLSQLAGQWLNEMELENLDPSIEGIVKAIRVRDLNLYREAYAKVRLNFQRAGRAQRRYALLAALREAAPILTENIESTIHDNAWDERVTIFSEAWGWAKTKSWVHRLADPANEQRLRIESSHLSDQIRTYLASLAAAKAWNHCLENLTRVEEQHLIAWTKAMRRLGKGTGKYAPEHRRAARTHMEQCRTAIPAWIMPLYRVAETMRPGVDMFDVAIIDEASQSGPEALLLTYLAKRLVVVGDSKQIVPDFVGVNRSDVTQLRRLHIQDLPHSDAIGAEGSFFDLAEICYQGNVRLQEHFRCMPEIIQFSNNLCYSAQPLIPLRQYSGDRLKPVVEAVHVEGGYRTGGGSNAVNPPEVDAIVNRIESMINDSRYRHKSIGVISLLGSTQARQIEQKLLERLGPENMEQWSIVCGDAYAFQGDERDVILLSMVSAVSEGHRIGVRSGAAHERRFNVAASRARDQLLLYHSVTLNDLSQSCLQTQLLKYCQHPAVDPLESAEFSTSNLKRLAETVQRDSSSPPDPFDSWFEVDVYVRISEKGYRVIPQVEMNGYRIDLVVDGMHGRLAVECDGDYWHGPEQYERDAGRQRTLERCGWHFWRVRGSTFYLNPDDALEGLWDALEKHGIFVGVTPGNDEIIRYEETSVDASYYQEHGIATEEPDDSDHNQTVEHPDNEDEMEVNSADREVASDSSSDRLNSEITEDAQFDKNGDSTEVMNQLNLGFSVPDQLPDPRSAPKKMVAEYLVKIVQDSGPIIVQHACQIYVKAAGYRKMGKNLRSALNKSMAEAIRAGMLEEEQEPGSTYFKDRVVRAKGESAVVVRSRGNRKFDEIPVLEIAAVMKKFRTESPLLDDEALYRKVLSHYDIKRLTQKISERLKMADF